MSLLKANALNLVVWAGLMGIVLLAHHPNITRNNLEIDEGAAMSNTPKLIKLHRSKHNRLLTGVLGVLAEYLGWKPTHMRLLFWAIIILSAGITLPMAVLAYVLMWILMPEATEDSYLIQDSRPSNSKIIN